LRAGSQDSVQALEAVLEVAETNKADLLTIGGDIFESPTDADELRGQLRPLFEKSPVQVAAIPGNHDGSIFSKGFDFGFPVSTSSPFEEIEFDDCCVVAVPYTDDSVQDMLPQLKRAGQTHDTRILLLHCTLDIGFDRSGYGEDVSRRYFPINRASLAALDYDFVLAGHFHTQFQTVEVGDSCKFVYPGSPYSITRKETGKRHVALVDTDKRNISRIELPTFYHDSLVVDLAPDGEKEAIKMIQDWYEARENDHCSLELAVHGFLKGDENKFGELLRKAAPEADLCYEARDISEVIEHPLYVRFMGELSNLEDADVPRVEGLVIRAISSLLAGGELD
jgi:DNA repair exonuclease SbcCD nuclease subunit